MPAHQSVMAASTLTAGLRNTFADAYKLTADMSLERLKKVMELGLPSDKLTEPYAYFETAPYPRRWPRGEAISDRPFKSVDFSVTNYDWGRRVTWHQNDREDDQTKTLFDQAKMLGTHFATLHLRIFFQMILAQTDIELLPAVPNAPDGSPIWSATAGDGSDRFGIAGGNILTGTGIASAMDIQNDVMDAIERFKQFQDTEGQPLWDEALLDNNGYMLIYNVANDSLVRQALKVSSIAYPQTNVAGSEFVGASAPASVVMEEGFKIELWPTQRVADNDMYCFAIGSPHKAIFQQERRGMQEAFANIENSDHARSTKEEYIQWDARYGYGVFLPYQAVQINNA